MPWAGAVVRLLPCDLEITSSNSTNNLSACGAKVRDAQPYLTTKSQSYTKNL